MEKITLIRTSIDVMDEQIMALLEERFNASLKIGALKKASNQPVLDSTREQFILNKIAGYSNKEAIHQVYLTILEASKLLQKKR